MGVTFAYAFWRVFLFLCVTSALFLVVDILGTPPTDE